MKLTVAEYCINVCGGKCCTLYDDPPVRCPRQSADGSCSIYKERYRDGAPDVMKVGRYKTLRRDTLGRPIYRSFYCGRIHDILAENELPEWIARQCCFAHPELLESSGEDNGS